MFVTLTQHQKGEALVLQTVIDNTCGKLNVALRGFHPDVDYLNVTSSSVILWRAANDRGDYPLDGSLKILAPAGLYNFKQLSQFLMGKIPGLDLWINRDNTISFYLQPYSVIKISNSMRILLGINNERWINGKYDGEHPVRFIIAPRLFQVYLDQLSTTSNIVDGAPSTLLAIVPVTAGGIVDVNPHYPMYKKLVVGHIDQLNLRVLDENGTIVQNRGTAVLEIRENA